MLTLYIGNKNYSSWSMRPWVLLRQLGVAFEEVKLRFDGFGPETEFKKRAFELSPLGRVPILVDEDVTVWDSLAICEYLAEQFPEKHMWPQQAAQRARARSLCAEVHSGFVTLRQLCPMNVEAQLPEIGAQLWADHAELRADVHRLEALWIPPLIMSKGPMLYDKFGIVDAYLAPLCMRLATYSLPISPEIDAYVRRIRTLPSVQEWMQGALAEHDFLQDMEPYRKALPAVAG